MSLTPGLLRWVVCLGLLCSSASDLFAPIYMKYDTIKGEVTASDYKDWIEVNSIQWGVGRGISSPTGGTSDREASAPNISEIVISKLQDVSSPYFFAEATFGEGKKVELHLVKTDDARLQPYLQITLDNCMISSYSQTSSGDRPSESLSLNFTKITLAYITQNSLGQTVTKTVSYDLAKGVGSGP
jgi:type VI secretion system secreted protein Hcp